MEDEIWCPMKNFGRKILPSKLAIKVNPPSFGCCQNHQKIFFVCRIFLNMKYLFNVKNPHSEDKLFKDCKEHVLCVYT